MRSHRGPRMRYILQGVMTAAWRNHHPGWRSFCRCASYTIIYLLQLCIGRLIQGRGVVLLFLAETWLREIDDRVDAGNHREAYAYLNAKLSIIDRSFTQRDGKDTGLEAILRQAQSIGVTILPELRTILELMRREVVWRMRGLPISRVDRRHLAASQDAAVLSVCAKVLRGDTQTCQEVISSFGGIMTRTDWLNDLPEDLRHDCFLLPAEFIQGNERTVEKLRAATNWDSLWGIPGFYRWYRAEVDDLEKGWGSLHSVLGNNCGNIFQKKVTGWLVHWALISELQSEFQLVKRRMNAAYPVL